MTLNNSLLAHISTSTSDLSELSILGHAITALLATESADNISKMLEEEDIRSSIESSTYELTTEMTATIRDGKYCFSYEESTLSGMEGATTEISFDPTTPELIYISRSGSIISTIVIEKGTRHLCTYQTPYMPIELVVTVRTSENHLTLTGGTMDLDYFIEIQGAAVQRIRLTLDASPTNTPGGNS